ncbi:hypothetical protein NKG94_14675 [Micromonospora sp. M12]
MLRLPNVKTVTARATGLVFDGGAVTGVRCDVGGVPGVERADLVVDAMGRSSRLSDWLEQAGWERPVTRRMTVHLNYATALFRRPEATPPRLSSWRCTPEDGVGRGRRRVLRHRGRPVDGHDGRLR